MSANEFLLKEEAAERNLRELFIYEALSEEVRTQTLVYTKRSAAATSQRKVADTRAESSAADYKGALARSIVERAAVVVDKLVEGLVAPGFIEKLGLVGIVEGVVQKYKNQGDVRTMWFHHVMSGAVKSDVSVALAAM